MVKIQVIKIDHRLSPLDASLTPEFSWEYGEASNGAIKGYRLLVASSQTLLGANEGDLWDSSFVESDLSFGIAYEGKPLKSRSRYFVKVIVIDGDGDTFESTSSFETRILDNEWLGSWIGAPVTWNGGALAIRRTLEDFGGKKIKKARAYIAGIGYNEFYVNGTKMSDSVLDPGVSDYDKRVFYTTYDITSSLMGKGDVVGVLLGYGWYGNRKLRAQFYVDFEDGTTYEAHSFCNYGWWFSHTPITSNSIYSGEHYDARIEDEYPGGFSSPKLKGDYNSHWFGGIHIQPVPGKLLPQEINPIRVLGSYPSEIIKEFSNEDKVYDIKQNIAGWCQIVVKGQRGAVVTLRHAETLKGDGHIDQTNLRTAEAKDVYILKGEGEETYAPRFTYHGFRYVEVTIEGKAEVLSLVGLHVHSDNKKVGAFECSDEKINKLHKMAVITEENNETSILTDCPQRDERFGWLNDVSTRVFQTCYNFEMDRFFNKVDQDISLAQDELGGITDTAPYYTGGRPADTTSLSYLLLARESYRYYGDKSTAKENYAGHKKWVDFLLSRSKNFIMDYYYYADWVSCDNYPDAKSDGICISSYFLYWHLVVLSELAKIVGQKEDEKHYSHLAALSREALNEKYLKGDHYHEGTQCEDAMALSLGLCPKENEDKVYAHLKQSIIDHDYHLTTGNQGYRHVMYELAERGDIDLLLKVLKNPTYPGWGFMLENGATTVWERWEKENQAMMNSFDHPMFGSYDATFYRFLAGIKINDIASNDIEIAPKIPSDMEHASGSIKTVRGTLKSGWIKKGHNIVYTITVPLTMKVKVTLEGQMLTLDDTKLDTNTFVLTEGIHKIATVQ